MPILSSLLPPPAQSAHIRIVFRQTVFRSIQLAADQSSPQSFSVSAMARFFAALLAAAAMFQVGSAAPYSFPNGTVPAAPPVPTASGSPNGTAIIANEVLKRRLRDFPIALHRP
ncbi:uncharacterized protein GGS22DRAFT_184747 [Annulohypoxylon maeteangense]|uniref:uncharacterized protein n=1 Tax=Annulohypoxylon maeteangense TaxID=1927788 RepID=UPI002008CB42|nr:uncharacterized protein GGS22DRAFT_184747 [Annulohypoxylon maeteangense]KAI0889170.1 hypothetical protein GGS22DRAFT_184747 [Annulohypoxylon maeteangense]